MSVLFFWPLEILYKFVFGFTQYKMVHFGIYRQIEPLEVPKVENQRLNFDCFSIFHWGKIICRALDCCQGLAQQRTSVFVKVSFDV